MCYNVSYDLVLALWPWSFTFWSWTMVYEYMASHVVILSTKFEDHMPIRSWVWVMASSIGHHSQYVCRHCTYAVPRDLRVLANTSHMKSMTPICEYTFQLTPLYDEHKANYLPRPYSNIALCTCAKSRDLQVGGQKQLHRPIWNSRPHYAYSPIHYTTFIVLRLLLRAQVRLSSLVFFGR